MIVPGDRVRHYAQQYTYDATATVIEVDGTEIHVKHDKDWPLAGNTESWWPAHLTMRES